MAACPKQAGCCCCCCRRCAESPPPAPAAAARPPATLLDPQLLMAARRGDSEWLKDLLKIEGDEEEKHGAAADDLPVAATAEQAVIVVQVDPPAAAPAPAPPAPPPPPPPPSAGGAASLPPLHENGLTVEGDSLLHVVAACGDNEGFLCCARMIVRDKEKKGGADAKCLVLEAKNNKGDTPLHCAAGAGNAEMISCLIGLLADTSEETKKGYLKMQNECGETPLHLAVHAYKNNKVCIDKLMDEVPHLAGTTDDEGTISPLYLAVSLGKIKIAGYLLEKTKGNLSYSGPDRRNVLHAAVNCGNNQALPMVLEWLDQEVKTGDDMAQEGQAETRSRSAASSADHLSKLTSQGDKENGSTPLHMAASVSGFPSTMWRPAWTWTRSGPAACWLLLAANESTAYQADKEGLYPIHIAASAGCLITVILLLERCPDCATLRDGKGRTFLHVAVENKRRLVVRYVCRNPGLQSILNVQDIQGDTAVHRAVHAGNLLVFQALYSNRQVRLDVPNKRGVRPIDVSWSTMPIEAYYAWDPRIHIRNLLLKNAVPYGESRGDLFMEKQTKTIREFGGEEKISDNLTSAVQVLAIFSVLITTVTFASAFTLPGGYKSDNGTPVLAGSYAFDAFVLADVLAFICSLLATFLLVGAGVPALSLYLRFFYVNLAYAFMMTSARSLVAAFGLGLYVALAPVARTIPIAVAVWIAMLASMFVTTSEGVDSFLTYPIIARRRKRSLLDCVSDFIFFVLQHFWSYILIFGIPAIRKWARAR